MAPTLSGRSSVSETLAWVVTALVLLAANKWVHSVVAVLFRLLYDWVFPRQV